MSQKEKEAAKKLAEAFDALPEAKKERLIGYAEGVADMVAKMPQGECTTGVMKGWVNEKTRG